MINDFLIKNLKIELHPEKSRIINLSKGIDFVGFRNFYYFKLLRKRSTRNMLLKIKKYKEGDLSKENLLESFQGWNAYAKWADTFNLRKKVIRRTYAHAEKT